MPIDRVVLSGPGSAIPGLSERLEQSIGLPFQIGRPSGPRRARRRRRRPPHPLLRPRPGELSDAADQPDPRRTSAADQEPARPGGPLAYILIGALVLLLAGVALLVSTNNQISSSKAEIAELEGENSGAKAKAAEARRLHQLEEVHDAAVATVTSLADSRFDWERVMRELSLILPRRHLADAT